MAYSNSDLFHAPIGCCSRALCWPWLSQESARLWVGVRTAPRVSHSGNCVYATSTLLAAEGGGTRGEARTQTHFKPLFATSPLKSHSPKQVINQAQQGRKSKRGPQTGKARTRKGRDREKKWTNNTIYHIWYKLLSGMILFLLFFQCSAPCLVNSANVRNAAKNLERRLFQLFSNHGYGSFSFNLGSRRIWV